MQRTGRYCRLTVISPTVSGRSPIAGAGSGRVTGHRENPIGDRLRPPLPWPTCGRRSDQAKGTLKPGTALMVKAWLRVLLLVSLAVPAAKAANLPDRTPIVITTDCGADMDDQWAIAHAALSPQVRTLAVIGNFAPEPHYLDSRETTHCARQALVAVGHLADILVHARAECGLPDRAGPVSGRPLIHCYRRLAPGFLIDSRFKSS
jgi:hypothetical protein